MAATPQKSDVPVATIGGEREGRPVVVVPDIEQAEKPKEEHATSIAEGKPEPGRNVFEGQPVKNAKSEAPKDPLPPVADKEISSVMTRDSSSSSGSSSLGSTSSRSGSDAGSSSSASASQTEIRNHGIQKAVGPLGEAEAEAEKAASELYPDAIKR
jgi:dolichyl-phosphate-mannose-protein mannosyltransferase